MTAPASPLTWPTLLRWGIALSMGAAISLGFARFAYALLLSPMREALAWDYATAGSLNTVNAVGYLIGALATPWLARRYSANALVAFGAWSTVVVMAVSPLVSALNAWLVLRTLAGMASALVFLSGGVLAARLGAMAMESADPKAQTRSAFLVALFYAGTGVGIAVSALAIPSVLQFIHTISPEGSASAKRWLGIPAWAWGWWALAFCTMLAALFLRAPLRAIETPTAVAQIETHAIARPRWQTLLPGLMGYACFGLGYIGYMTFCIALLREQGGGNAQSIVFFLALGVACMFSAQVWGRLMRREDGRPMAILNAFTGGATLLAALSAQPLALLISAIIFGGCFLQVVGSTTALVRHHWPASHWARGITIFTCVFAAGQVAGPLLTGLISDSALGLRGGLIASGLVLLLGAIVALAQRAPVRQA